MNRTAPIGFDPSCVRCERLAAHLIEVRRSHPDYHAGPVPPFGDPDARLLIVGLAPGMHGANATGRPFTGDYAGILLYQTLHRFGFADRPESTSRDDGLTLIDCRITNAVKCLPPQNKPTGGEVATCNAFLIAELQTLPANAVVLALGGVAHRAVIRALGLRQSAHAFAHGAEHRLEHLTVLDCYHCSRYNTQTKRLTEPMFLAIFERVRALLK
ncbi:MAG: uracil-DNA glycosylase [Gammaproteobacteria bacterium]